ncbi:PLP-dependent aminotransferase family protein [Brevibacillus fluminis]|uniref:PLP-dependent aminotransferase family protein n=1 Tax=Brevibacillus fluminis TaxID=511487 RepID=A0A3M8CWI2_9BACL|nr:PLP-dependent aminotransferase family protein [Brevibacillus fluminis]RNB80124.1 PLP-dependent aminotransferase family protein [Brevibacillus fluminis]
MDYQFAKSIVHLESSVVRDILKLTQGNEIISFAGGLPAEEYFPVEAVKDAYDRVLDSGTKALQYGLTEGFLPLREKMCERMRVKKNMHVEPDNMILTTGSQQALDLLARVYLDEGDIVLVEDPTYLAALQSFRSHGVTVVAVESDSLGMNIDDLHAKIKAHKPKLVYVVPTFSNPAGRVWSTERRLGLLAACRANNVLILEDDPYGEIKFDPEADYPTILSLDQHPHDSAVVYLGSFSKTVAPGLRTGWAMGDKRVIQAMAKVKQASDLQSSSIDQQALYQLFVHFALDEHLAVTCAQYKKRMENMHDLFVAQNLSGFTINKPAGGMFFWGELAEGMDASELLKIAVQEGVAFVPGAPFCAGAPMKNTLRLNFTHNNEERTKLGVERFANAYQAYMTQVVK